MAFDPKTAKIAFDPKTAQLTSDPIKATTGLHRGFNATPEAQSVIDKGMTIESQDLEKNRQYYSTKYGRNMNVVEAQEMASYEYGNRPVAEWLAKNEKAYNYLDEDEKQDPMEKVGVPLDRELSEFEARLFTGNVIPVVDRVIMGRWIAHKDQQLAFNLATNNFDEMEKDRAELRAIEKAASEAFPEYKNWFARGFAGLAATAAPMTESILLGTFTAGKADKVYWATQGAGGIIDTYLTETGRSIKELSDDQLMRLRGASLIGGAAYAAVEYIGRLAGLQGKGGLDDIVQRKLIGRLAIEAVDNANFFSKLKIGGVKFLTNWLLENSEEGVQETVTQLSVDTVDGEVNVIDAVNKGGQAFVEALPTTMFMAGGAVLVDQAKPKGQTIFLPYTLGDAVRFNKQRTDEEIINVANASETTEEGKQLKIEMLRNPSEESVDAYNDYRENQNKAVKSEPIIDSQGDVKGEVVFELNEFSENNNIEINDGMEPVSVVKDANGNVVAGAYYESDQDAQTITIVSTGENDSATGVKQVYNDIVNQLPDLTEGQEVEVETTVDSEVELETEPLQEETIESLQKRQDELNEQRKKIEDKQSDEYNDIMFEIQQIANRKKILENEAIINNPNASASDKSFAYAQLKGLFEQRRKNKKKNAEVDSKEALEADLEYYEALVTLYEGWSSVNPDASIFKKDDPKVMIETNKRNARYTREGLAEIEAEVPSTTKKSIPIRIKVNNGRDAQFLEGVGFETESTIETDDGDIAFVLKQKDDASLAPVVPFAVDRKSLSERISTDVEFEPFIKELEDQGLDRQQAVNFIVENIIGTDTDINIDFNLDEQVNNARKSLSENYGDVQIILHETHDSFVKATNMPNARGDYDPATKTIHISRDKANRRTVAHETFHAIFLRDVTTEAEANELAKNLYKSVYKNASPELKADLDAHTAKYGEELRSEEGLSELLSILANNSDALTSQDRTVLSKLMDFFKNILNTLGLDISTDEQVIDMLGILGGKVGSGEVITEEDVDLLNIASGKVTGKLKDIILRRSAIDKVDVERLETNPNTKVIKFDTRKLMGKFVSITESDRLVGGKIGDKRFLGGIFYPIITGRIWASDSLSAANSIINQLKKDADGYYYLIPAIMSATSHLSNRNMMKIIFEYFEDAVLKGDVDVGLFKERVLNALDTIKTSRGEVVLDLTKYKLDVESLLDSPDSPENKVNSLFQYIIDNNFTFEERKEFIIKLLGDATKQMPKNFYDAVGTMSTLGKLFSDPALEDVNNREAITVIRFKGKPKVVKTKKDDEFYHESYEYHIEPSKGKVEVLFLNDVIDVTQAVTSFTVTDKKTGEVKRYSSKLALEEARQKGQSRLFALSNLFRTMRLASFSSRITTSEKKLLTRGQQMDFGEDIIRQVREKLIADGFIPSDYAPDFRGTGASKVKALTPPDPADFTDVKEYETAMAEHFAMVMMSGVGTTRKGFNEIVNEIPINPEANMTNIYNEARKRYKYIKGVTKKVEKRSPKKLSRIGIDRSFRQPKEKRFTQAEVIKISMRRMIEAQLLQRKVSREQQRQRKLKLRLLQNRAKAMLRATISDKAERDRLEKQIPNLTTINALDAFFNRVLEAQAKQEQRDALARAVKVLRSIGKVTRWVPRLQKRIAEITDTITTTRLSAKKQRVLESRKDYVEREENNLVPTKRIKELERLDQNSLRDMSAEKINKIVDELERLLIMNQQIIALKNRFKSADLETQKRALIQQLKNRKALKGIFDKILNNAFFNMLRKYQHIVEEFDGNEQFGNAYQILLAPLVYARSVLQSSTEITTRGMLEVKKKLPAKWDFDRRDSVLTLDSLNQFGQAIEYKVVEVMGIFAHSLNTENRRYLRENHGLTDEQIDQLIAQLTDVERTAVRETMEVFDSQYEGANRVNEILTGGEQMPRIKNYMPLIFKREKIVSEESDLLTGNNINNPYINDSFTFKRIGTGKMELDLDFFNVATRHIRKVNHYSAYAVAIKKVQSVLADPQVRAEIERLIGANGYEQLISTIVDTANPSQYDLGYSGLREVLLHARLAQSIVNLGLGIVTGFVQFSSMPLTMRRIGVSNAVEGLKLFIKNPKQAVKRVSDASVMMQNRSSNFDREYREFLESKDARSFFADTITKVTNGKLSGEKLRKANDNMVEFSFFMIRSVDMFTAYSSWLGAYNKAVSIYGRDNEELLVRYADDVVSKTQPMSDIMNLAKIQRGSQWQKLIVNFYTAMSHVYNEMDVNLRGALRKDISTMQFVRGITFVVLIPSIFGHIIRGAGDEDDDLNEELLDYSKSLGSYLGGTVPIFGNMISSMWSPWDYNPVPVLTDPIKYTKRAAQQFGNEDWAKAWGNLGRASGYLARYPSKAVVRFIEGSADLINDETDNVLVLFKYVEEDSKKSSFENPTKSKSAKGKSKFN